ncbi:MAG: hypothetical protein K8E24_005645 [Methanobacterium paludis]|nr:hypothetical protein [Methanobacterium paludis]
MKIRGDFVTNSSSVSFILTMNESTVNEHIKNFKGTGIPRYLGVIKDKIKKNSEKLKIGNNELYHMEIDIDPQETISMDEYTSDSTPFNIDFTQPPIFSLNKPIILLLLLIII